MVQYENTFIFKSALQTLNAALKNNYNNALKNSETMQLLADIVVDFKQEARAEGITQAYSMYHVLRQYAETISEYRDDVNDYLLVIHENGNMIDLSFDTQEVAPDHTVYRMLVGRAVVNQPEILFEIHKYMEDGIEKFSYQYYDDHFKIVKGDSIAVPVWISEFHANPQTFFRTALDRVLQNEQIQGMYSKAVQLYVEGGLTISKFRDWVHDTYYGLKDEALTIYNNMVACIEQGISSVVTFIKDYADHIKSAKVKEDGSAFEFPTKSLYVTKSWDWGLVVSQLGKLAELVGVLLMKIVNPIVGAIVSILGFAADFIGNWVTNSYSNEVTFQVQDVNNSIGYVNPMIQVRFDMTVADQPYYQLADKIIPALRANGAYNIHIPGIECIVFPTYGNGASHYPTINACNIELRLACDYMINKDFFLQDIVVNDVSAVKVYMIPPYSTLVAHGSFGNSIGLDSATNEQIAAMIASAYLCYFRLLDDPIATTNIGNPGPNTPAWIMCAIKCCEYLEKYFRGESANYDTFMASFNSYLTSICALEKAPVDSDMSTAVVDVPNYTPRFLYPLRYIELIMDCDSYENGGNLHFSQQFAINHPDAYLDNQIFDFPAPSIYPPKYTRGAKIFGYALSFTIVAAVTLATVYSTVKIKKYTNQKAAMNASAVENAWSELSKNPTKENYNNYFKAVKRNNRWATLGVGTKISSANYWASPTTSAVDTSQVTEQLKTVTNKMEDDESSSEAKEVLPYSLEDIYLLLRGNPLNV